MKRDAGIMMITRVSAWNQVGQWAVHVHGIISTATVMKPDAGTTIQTRHGAQVPRDSTAYGRTDSVPSRSVGTSAIQMPQTARTTPTT